MLNVQYSFHCNSKLGRYNYNDNEAMIIIYDYYSLYSVSLFMHLFLPSLGNRLGPPVLS